MRGAIVSILDRHTESEDAASALQTLFEPYLEAEPLGDHAYPQLWARASDDGLLYMGARCVDWQGYVYEERAGVWRWVEGEIIGGAESPTDVHRGIAARVVRAVPWGDRRTRKKIVAQA